MSELINQILSPYDPKPQVERARIPKTGSCNQRGSHGYIKCNISVRESYRNNYCSCHLADYLAALSPGDKLINYI